MSCRSGECRIGNWPMPYLGLKVGGRMNSIEAWKDSMDRVKGEIKRIGSQFVVNGKAFNLGKGNALSNSLYKLSFFTLPKIGLETIQFAL